MIEERGELSLLHMMFADRVCSIVCNSWSSVNRLCYATDAHKYNICHDFDVQHNSHIFNSCNVMLIIVGGDDTYQEGSSTPGNGGQMVHLLLQQLPIFSPQLDRFHCLHCPIRRGR